MPCRYKAQQERINEFVHFHSLPASLKSKLHRYNKFLFAVNRGFDVGQIAKALPPNLQRDVRFHMHARLVKSVPLFEVCDEALLKGLVCVLHPQVLLRGDWAFRIGTVGDEMYFIRAQQRPSRTLLARSLGESTEGEGGLRGWRGWSIWCFCMLPVGRPIRRSMSHPRVRGRQAHTHSNPALPRRAWAHADGG